MKKKDPVFLIGGILMGALAALPFITVGAACSYVYHTNWLVIPFMLGAGGVFALIQFIVSGKRFPTLRNFYLMSAVVSLGILILIVRITLTISQGLILRLVPFFETERGAIVCAVILYAAFAMCFLIYAAVFGLITKHKSDYISRITEGVRRIASEGEDIIIQEEGHDELTVLCRNINQMNADLRENRAKRIKSERQKNELISNVSHDLRSPLTSIIGYVQLLKEYTGSNDERFSEYIEVIDRRLGGMNKLINELFELTRMDSPNFIMNMEQGDVTAFVRQFGYEMSAILRRNDLDLKYNIDNAGFLIEADFERLARVMENLFANVLKYAVKHTEVLLESNVGESNMLISISNHVSEKTEINTESMFDRFYRDDQARTDADSAGLGLAIARKIVELHGGRVSAERSGNVITVSFSLPRKI